MVQRRTLFPLISKILFFLGYGLPDGYEKATAAAGLLLQTISWGPGDNIETQLRVIKTLPIMERVAIRLGWIEAKVDTSDEWAQAQRINTILALQSMVFTT